MYFMSVLYCNVNMHENIIFKNINSLLIAKFTRTSKIGESLLIKIGHNISIDKES